MTVEKKQRYKIVNDTIKPIKLNSKGQDVRPNKERIGYAVQFYKGVHPHEVLVTVYQNRETIVDDIDEAILTLYRKGAITITPISDIADELKKFSQKPINAIEGKKDALPEESVTFISGTSQTPYEPKTPKELKAKASAIGSSPAVEEPGVYTDGEPNFFAKAPAGGIKRSKKEDTVVAV